MSVYVCVCLYFDLYSSLTTLLCLLLGPLTWLSDDLMSPSSFFKYLIESNCVAHMHIAVAPFTQTWVAPQQSHVQSKVTQPSTANISAASGLGLGSQSPIRAGILAGLLTCR